MIGIDLGGAFLKMVEERHGRKMAGWVVTAIVFGIFVAVAGGTVLVLDQAIAFFGKIYKFFEESKVFETDLAPAIIALILVIATLTIIIVLGGFVILNLAKRTMIPQQAIDELAQLRADGINEIFAKKPTDATDLGRWESKYNAWQERVKKHLEANFTRADFLRFLNLGRVEILPFDQSMIFSSDHLRLVRLMSKQLDIIEEFLATYRRQ